MSKKAEVLLAQVRQLRQDPENKQCFDCGERGPQYVCLPFSTFVCVSCSGLHREFNHRVKGINASEFSESEVAALKVGGNAVAKKIYLARYQPSDFPIPDATVPQPARNQRLKEFMRLKYIDRRWAEKATKEAKKTEKPKSEKSKSKPKPKKQSDELEEEEPPKPKSVPPVRFLTEVLPDVGEIVVKRKNSTGMDDSAPTKPPKPTSKPPETKSKPQVKVQPVEVAPKKTVPVEQVSRGIEIILNFDSDPAPTHSSAKDDDWADFDTSPAKVPVQPAPSSTNPSLLDFQTSPDATEPKAEVKTENFFDVLADSSPSTVTPQPTAVPSTLTTASVSTPSFPITPNVLPTVPQQTMLSTPMFPLGQQMGVAPTVEQWQAYQLYQQQMYQQQQMYYYQLYLAAQQQQAKAPAGHDSSQPPPATAPNSSATSARTSAFDDLGTF